MTVRAALLLTLASLAGCASGPPPTTLQSLRVTAAPDANLASATAVDLVFVSDERANAALPATSEDWFAAKEALSKAYPTMVVLPLQLPAGVSSGDVALPAGYRKAIGVYIYANYRAPGGRMRITLTNLVHTTLYLEHDHINLINH